MCSMGKHGLSTRSGKGSRDSVEGVVSSCAQSEAGRVPDRLAKRRWRDRRQAFRLCKLPKRKKARIENAIS